MGAGSMAPFTDKTPTYMNSKRNTAVHRSAGSEHCDFIPSQPVTKKDASSVCPLTSRADSCLAWGVRAGSLFEMPSMLNNQMLYLSAPPRHHFISNTRTREIRSVALDVHRMGSHTHTHLTTTESGLNTHLLICILPAPLQFCCCTLFLLFFFSFLALSFGYKRRLERTFKLKAYPWQMEGCFEMMPTCCESHLPGATSHATTKEKAANNKCSMNNGSLVLDHCAGDW